MFINNVIIKRYSFVWVALDTFKCDFIINWSYVYIAINLNNLSDFDSRNGNSENDAEIAFAFGRVILESLFLKLFLNLKFRPLSLKF